MSKHWKSKKNLIIQEIADYWEELWEYKYSLNLRGKNTVKQFLSFLNPMEIKESMEIAVCRIDSDVSKCFQYFCGVVYTKKKQKYGQK